MRLYINVDHVATVRQARRADEPDPVEAARLCEAAGADGITVHLREDRRHIQDDDVRRLAADPGRVLNLELATVPDIVRIAVGLRPHQATIVPEHRQEITTEGGLQLESPGDPPTGPLADAIGHLKTAGIRVSLFIDPDEPTVERAARFAADAVELHTGEYANARGSSSAPLDRLATAARRAVQLGLAVHAGHGLTTANVSPVAAIPEVEELSIGHHVVSRGLMVGLEQAVRELRQVIDRARGP